MPLVRSISHDAASQQDRFSALVMGVVKSKPFQMNAKVPDDPASKVGRAAPAEKKEDRKGAD
jgi:hypothetical protein